jgi:uncharacterized repeat protein (TIGR01451 family)
VKNVGTAEASASDVGLYVSGSLSLKQAKSVEKLGAGAWDEGDFDAEDCPPGTTIPVDVRADCFLTVGESNEDNNWNNITVDCPAGGQQPGGPDLVITKWVEKQALTPTQCQFKVHYTVRNIGNAKAGAHDIAKYFDGKLEDTKDSLTTLGPGASYTDDFGWENCTCKDCACGATLINVTVWADCYKLVKESNESNNCDTNFENCRKGDIEVQKTVWDGPNRVEEIDAAYGDVVKFNCTVHNTGCCCDLTQITVTDVLSDSLKYINATPAPDMVDNVSGVTTLTWRIVADPLEPCKWLNYTINASVIGCGVDTNTQSAVATNCTGGTVEDSDTAKVKVAVPGPRIDVDKKVWDGDSWEDENVTARNIQQTYRCTVHNAGCCDLTNVVVWDTLPIGLHYDGVGPNTPPPVVTGNNATGTTLTWTVPAPFEHCETVTYTILATPLADAGTVYDNVQHARGYCAATDTWADDLEDARVTT